MGKEMSVQQSNGPMLCSHCKQRPVGFVVTITGQPTLSVAHPHEVIKEADVLTERVCGVCVAEMVTALNGAPGVREAMKIQLYDPQGVLGGEGQENQE